ncbi:unnamed protein product [Medioppia subpectinata]|uniref:SMC hinge domain-containing protein n=1 Tax=Medioppia subpectinata TaxID=1979941 RepID=A0A7R9KRY5_9ACAR|nr:unnamed protein product [Medioppia subpectinata]CAG2108738.1 unnamed protein product [Medioppia subpectinata]
MPNELIDWLCESVVFAMHIKCIILNGFKSYGTETKIDGFDHLFNAITGLNGSGKSNILDAICFVLGLSRMDLARCNNLRELIYKNGQTGVTKASVSIKFDNKDKKQCPAGYENFDEIVITREVNMNSRSKYWINGFTSNNQSVTDLFHSVSLNIHNPHFLIMQGRITKVLNMKPNEILSMVEEATGVSMYELKKKSTQNMIEKKDSALRVIDALINETIVPKLDQLKKEQSGLMEFQKISAELESLTKVFIAFQFLKEEENCLKASHNIEAKNDEIKGNQQLIAEAETKAKDIETNIKTLEKKKDEEFGGKLSQLEDKLKSEQLSEAKHTGELNIASDELKEKEKKEIQFCKNLEGDRKITGSKQKQLDSFSEKLDRLRGDNELKEETLKKAEKDFEDISAGKSRAQEGEASATLADQLMTAQKEIATAETDIKKAEMKIKHSKSELNKKDAEVKKVKNTYEKDMKEINAMNSEVEKLRRDLEGLGFDEQRHTDLRANLGQTKRQIDKLSDEISSAESQMSRVRFDYKDPHHNFDRSAVIGVVCNLFRVRDTKYAYALEKAVGGRLYNVVMRDSQSAKAILDRGQLRERRTLIPLDRIQGYDADPRALKRARNIVGHENVDYAINYVDYDPSLSVAMKHVFGDTMIVPDMEIAKRIVYEVHKTAVTLDGEVIEPSGVLSGGSTSQGTQLLAKVAEILDKRRMFEELKHSMTEMEREFQNLNKDSKNYMTTKQSFELKEREAELVRQRLQQGNSAHSLMEEIEALRQTIETEEKALKDCAEIKKNSTKRVNELNDKLKNSKSIREREHKEAEQNLKNDRSTQKQRKLNYLYKNITRRQVDKQMLDIPSVEEITQQFPEVTESPKKDILMNAFIKRIDGIDIFGLFIANIVQKRCLREKTNRDNDNNDDNLSLNMKQVKQLSDEHNSEVNPIGKQMTDGLFKQLANAIKFMVKMFNKCSLKIGDIDTEEELIQLFVVTLESIQLILNQIDWKQLNREDIHAIIKLISQSMDLPNDLIHYKETICQILKTLDFQINICVPKASDFEVNDALDAVSEE